MKLTDSANMREADKKAVSDYGISPIALMANAAEALADAAAELSGTNRSALVFCGPGNNGGDGVGAAALLLSRGYKIRAVLTGDREKQTPDCAEMERRFNRIGGRLEELEESADYSPDSFGVLIDAMFGIGFRSVLTGPALFAANLMNASKTPVVSADIPSGVLADSGTVSGTAVKADVTVAFSMAKAGNFIEPGCVYSGRVLIKDIGVPGALLKAAETGAVSAVRDISLPRRPRISHKGDYGRIFVCGGSVGYTGAPTICAKAAVRSGAGLVYLGVPGEIYAITAIKNDEAMTFALPGDSRGKLGRNALGTMLERANACTVTVLGPGLGRSEDLTQLVRAFVRSAETRLVLDADALFALDVPSLKEARRTPVLTPHEGEFARLFWPVSDRLNDAKRAARESGCIVVLKGHRTICAFPDGEVFVNTTGNPGMAKGGTGDALTGVTAALLCVLPEKKAVPAAVWLHGRAGDICAERLGEYSMTVTDLIETLPQAFAGADEDRG